MNTVSKKIRGFTIVELLIAAVIMIVATFAVITVLRKSTEIEVEDHHERQARMIIMGLFEDVFDYRAYPNSYGVFSIDSGQTSFDTTYEVVIDKRGFRSNPLMGNMNVNVRRDSSDINGVMVHMDRITASIDWKEADGTRDTVTLRKVLADVE